MQYARTFTCSSAGRCEYCHTCTCVHTGFGTLTEKDGGCYEGEFHRNRRHGEGSQVYGNGDQYKGDWVEGRKHGQGVLRCSDGTVYDVSFIHVILFINIQCPYSHRKLTCNIHVLAASLLMRANCTCTVKQPLSRDCWLVVPHHDSVFSCTCSYM